MPRWQSTGCQVLRRTSRTHADVSYVHNRHFRGPTDPSSSSFTIRAYSAQVSKLTRTDNFPCDAIRNFSIIAHIDHGKSTLADRLLEITGTISKSSLSEPNKQVLDKLKVERERGITVKAQTASMAASLDGKRHLLNLIDTPGHVDFSWEVSRSLSACQGALLLVDATQGVQAQSITVFHIARARKLKIIPVLNKIDLPQADPERICAQISSTFGLDPSEVLRISAKTGDGVNKVLEEIIRRIPPPPDVPKEEPLKAFLFDSSYDRYRGVICLMSIRSGTLRKGDKIVSVHTGKKYDVQEVGLLSPEETPMDSLNPGQVGYCVCNMKNSSEAHIGDTFHIHGHPVPADEGFKPTQPMVFAGVFPVDSNDFIKLEESIRRLTLTDRSVAVQRETSSALGQGCRLGFLGSLHMDVFRQRLEDEYDANVIITAPTVPFEVVYTKGPSVMISNPTEFPDDHGSNTGVSQIKEPMVDASIIVPQDYLGEMIELCTARRSTEISHRYLEVMGAAGVESAPRVIVNARLPLAEVVTDFFDVLKSRSSGYASFDYEDGGYESCRMRKMTFLLNGKAIDALATIVHASAAQEIGRFWTKKLKEVIPRKLFEIAIQAVVGGKVVARETLPAMRKDVTAGLYGGHYERKLKHLNKQKEGKKKMKMIGRIELHQAAFYDILSTK